MSDQVIEYDTYSAGISPAPINGRIVSSPLRSQAIAEEPMELIHESIAPPVLGEELHQQLIQEVSRIQADESIPRSMASMEMVERPQPFYREANERRSLPVQCPGDLGSLGVIEGKLLTAKNLLGAGLVAAGGGLAIKAWLKRTRAAGYNDWMLGLILGIGGAAILAGESK